MSSLRQLAVIVFTDIVGYTALMGEDEEKAFDVLRKNRNIQRPLIEQHGGKLIKEIGDGILASFTTATEGVLCAKAIQQTCQTHDDLKLRIGIHLGEVIFEDGDVFGDGVNIASRLQAMAPISGIWISESVYQNISNKKEFTTKFIGTEILKNVKEPVHVYEVAAHPTTTGTENHQPLVKGYGKSIAVMPFLNISNDPEQEYISHGMAEEIINSLAHIKDLKVAGRMSSFQFKSAGADLREVGQKLGVETILEGSIRRQGDTLRVTAQLVDVKNGFHIWSEKYDRKMDDIFAIQDEIALAITAKLKVALKENEKASIVKSYTHNTEAYELYLKGRFYINRRGPYILQGYQNFERAIQLDPGFAPAYAGFADACLLSAYYAFYPSKEVMPKAKKAADAAISIDKTLCEPYTSLGFYYAYYEWNWAESKKNFRKAIELNPEYVTGIYWYSMLYLSWIEQNFKESQRYGSIAIKLDPLSTIAHAIQSINYYVTGQYEEAVRLGKETIELDANHYLAYQMTGLAYIGLEKYPEAIELLTHAVKMSNRYQWAIFNLAWAYHKQGDRAKMKELIDELDARSEYISPFHRALAAAWDDDIDLAIKYLEKAFDDRDPILLSFNTWPNVPDTLKNDPRCQDIIRRINFPV